MPTSQKHRNFVAEPMGNKLVTALAGIGDALGGRLTKAGFLYAYQVLAKYLELNKDEMQFKRWLHHICSANSEHQRDCYMCLRDWCSNFLNRSTSEKYKEFATQPMDDKPVTKIEGIDDDLGENLKANGFTYAYQVLGKYLELNKDENQFKLWLHHICSANSEQQRDCYMCLRVWCSNFLNRSTSQKYKEFVTQPIGDKPVTKIAGIGKALGKKLKGKKKSKRPVLVSARENLHVSPTNPEAKQTAKGTMFDYMRSIRKRLRSSVSSQTAGSVICSSWRSGTSIQYATYIARWKRPSRCWASTLS